MDQILTKDGLIYVLYYNDGSYIRSNATDQEGATDQLYILREKNGICEEVGKSIPLKLMIHIRMPVVKMICTAMKVLAMKMV